MGNTIYASFADPALAEKAAGALLDFGVQADDISLVRGHSGDLQSTNYGTGITTPISENVVAVEAPNMGGRLLGQPSQFTTDSTSDLMDPAGTHNMAGARMADDAAPGYNTAVSSPSTTIGSETEWRESAEDLEESAKHGISTTTPEDAGAGAMKGAAWGAGVGVLAALASLVVPGFGLVAGGGALAIAIGGVVASTGAGAAAGAVTGYLKDQGVEGHVAEHYERTVHGGGALLAVTVPSGAVGEFEARNILEKYGAGNVNVYASRGYLA